MFCSELCTKGFQQLKSPGVLGWVSEKLPTSLPRSLSWIQVLVGAPVCWRPEEFGRGTWTEFDQEDLAVLMFQKRRVRYLKWRPPSPKERIESEGRAHPQLIPEEASAENGQSGGGEERWTGGGEGHALQTPG